MEKIFSALPAECSEKNFSPLPAQFGEKKLTAKIANLTNIHRANFNTCLEFTGNIIEVSDKCRRGIRSCWHAEGERFKPVYGSFFFVSNPVNAVKKIFSPLKTAKFTAFNAKKMRALCCEKSFFFTATHR